MFEQKAIAKLRAKVERQATQLQSYRTTFAKVHIFCGNNRGRLLNCDYSLNDSLNNVNKTLNEYRPRARFRAEKIFSGCFESQSPVGIYPKTNQF